MPQTLPKELRNLYRKERFLVFNFAAGDEGSGRPPLSLKFRNDVKKALKLKHSIPARAFWAIDYHLDWLDAALNLSRSSEPREAIRKGRHKGTQEDVDLVVAYPAGGKTVLILIEAKGVTPWKQKQLDSKVKELQRIIGPTPPRDVDPHWLLASPDRTSPRHIKAESWPKWMRRGARPIHIPIEMPQRVDQLMRCDSKGKRSSTGGCWRVIPERASGRSRHDRA